MRLRWGLSLLLMMLLLSTVVVSAQPVKLVMGFPYGGELEEMQVLIDKFNDTHDQIQVELRQTGFEDFTVQYAGGAAPDIQYIWPTKDWAVEGVLVPLDQYLDRDGLAGEWKEDFVPSLYDFHTYQGKLYAAPFQLWGQGAFLNVRHFEEAGVELPPDDWTWEQHHDYAQQMVRRNPDGTTARWATGFHTNGWFFISLLNSAGGEAFDWETMEPTWESDAGRKAVEWVRSHIEEDLAVVGSNEQMWMDQKLSWHLRGSFALNRFKREMQDEIAVVNYPRDTYPANAVGGEGIAIVATGNEDRYDAAWEVVRWLTLPDQILHWVRVQGAIPSRLSVARSPEFIDMAKEEPARMMFFEGARTTPRPYPDWLAAEDLMGVIRPWFQKAIEGEVPDVEALANMASEARALYAEIDVPLR